MRLTIAYILGELSCCEMLKQNDSQPSWGAAFVKSDKIVVDEDLYLTMSVMSWLLLACGLHSWGAGGKAAH